MTGRRRAGAVHPHGPALALLVNAASFVFAHVRRDPLVAITVGVTTAGVLLMSMFDPRRRLLRD